MLHVLIWSAVEHGHDTINSSSPCWVGAKIAKTKDFVLAIWPWLWSWHMRSPEHRHLNRYNDLPASARLANRQWGCMDRSRMRQIHGSATGFLFQLHLPSTLSISRLAAAICEALPSKHSTSSPHALEQDRGQVVLLWRLQSSCRGESRFFPFLPGLKVRQSLHLPQGSESSQTVILEKWLKPLNHHYY